MSINDLTETYNSRLTDGIGIYLTNIKNNENNDKIFYDIVNNILRIIFAPPNTASYHPKYLI